MLSSFSSLCLVQDFEYILVSVCGDYYPTEIKTAAAIAYSLKKSIPEKYEHSNNLVVAHTFCDASYSQSLVQQYLQKNQILNKIDSRISCLGFRALGWWMITHRIKK